MTALWILGVLGPPPFGAAPALAAPTLTVQIDKESVALGDSVRLRLRAVTDRSSGGRAELKAPQLNGWALVGQSESTRDDRRRGVKSTRITLTLQAEKSGTLVIPPFELITPTKTVRSKQLTIEVRDGGLAKPTAPAAPGVRPPPRPLPPGTPQPGTLQPGQTQSGGDPQDAPPAADAAPDEAVFLRWEVDRDSMWLGEQVDAKLYIYIRDGIAVRDFEVGKIDLTGFWTEENKLPRRRSSWQVVGGLRFERQTVAHYTLYPLRAGTRQLPEVSAEMLVRRAGRFGGPRSRITRAAQAVPLEVKALPTTGRPRGFAGPAVGRIRLQATLDQSQIKGDGGVQLSVVTRVDGLVQNVPEVALPELPQWKVFPSTSETRTDERAGKKLGVRRQTWLLRPLESGRLQVPALRLPYFDPKTGRYAVARSRPATVRVDGEPTATADAPEAEAPEALALRPIRPEIDATARPMNSVGVWFELTLFGAPLLFLLGIGLDRMRRHRDATAGSRAARNAARSAREQLAEFKRDMRDPRAGYSAIAKVLVTYLETRFEAPFNGLTRDQIGAALRARSVDEGAIQAMLDELDACDFARFAQTADAADGLPRAADRAIEAVDGVEGSLG